MVREPFIQAKDGVASWVKGSGSCLVSTNPIKPMEEIKAKKGNSNEIVGLDNEGKGLSKGNWKRLAREKGKAQDVDMNAQAHEVGKKRGGNLEALIEAEGIDKKGLCEGKDYGENHGDYETAMSVL